MPFMQAFKRNYPQTDGYFGDHSLLMSPTRIYQDISTINLENVTGIESSHETEKSYGYNSPSDDADISRGEKCLDYALLMRSPSARASKIRIGSSYQVDNLPSAGSYLRDAETCDSIQQMELVWDFTIASSQGCFKFLEHNCPKDKLEVAMDMLSKNGYRHSCLLKTLQELPPNDGSDWTLDEQHRFHILVEKFSHDLKKVAIEMDKPILQCFIFYYGLGQKIRTRSRTFSHRPVVHQNVSLSDNHRLGMMRRVTRRGESLPPPQGSVSCIEQAKDSRSSRTSANESSARENVSKVVSFDNSFDSEKQPKKRIRANHVISNYDLVLDHEVASFDEQQEIVERKRTRTVRDMSKTSAGQKSITESDSNTEHREDVNKDRAKRSSRQRHLSVSRSLPTNTRSLSSNRRDPPTVTKMVSVDAYESQMWSGFSMQTREVAILPLNSNSPLSEPGSTSEISNSFAKEDDSNDTQTTRTLRERHPPPIQTQIPQNASFFYKEKWDFYVNELMEFKREHGHCLVPKIFPTNQSLSRWVFKVRGYYRDRHPSFTKAKVKQLTEIGFQFSAKASKEQVEIIKAKRLAREDEHWLNMYSQLVAYKNTHGHCLIPKIYPQDQILSFWVFRQRHLHVLKMQGQETNLSDERLKKLNDIGFVWVVKEDKKWKELTRKKVIESFEDTWEHRFQELKLFKKKYGHTNVPKVYPQNQLLSAFVFGQKSKYRLRKAGKLTTLTDERLEKLKSIGFAFRSTK